MSDRIEICYWCGSSDFDTHTYVYKLVDKEGNPETYKVCTGCGSVAEKHDIRGGYYE